jgi:hypothetical protein
MLIIVVIKAFLVLLHGWLKRSYGTAESGNSLLSIDEVGAVLGGWFCAWP